MVHPIRSLSFSKLWISRLQWPRGLRHELFSLAWTLGSWVRMPLKACIYVCDYSVFVLGSGLVTDWSPVQGVLPTVLGLRNWSETKRFTNSLCSKLGATWKRESERETLVDSQVEEQMPHRLGREIAMTLMGQMSCCFLTWSGVSVCMTRQQTRWLPVMCKEHLKIKHLLWL
jgi:hypothetical protein